MKKSKLEIAKLAYAEICKAIASIQNEYGIDKCETPEFLEIDGMRFDWQELYDPTEVVEE